MEVLIIKKVYILILLIMTIKSIKSQKKTNLFPKIDTPPYYKIPFSLLAYLLKNGGIV
jgi:hypothetical protein